MKKYKSKCFYTMKNSNSKIKKKQCESVKRESLKKKGVLLFILFLSCFFTTATELLI